MSLINNTTQLQEVLNKVNALPNATPSFEVDETLHFENGVLGVNTATDAEQDNTLPITSAAVYDTLGNIEILLSTI